MSLTLTDVRSRFNPIEVMKAFIIEHEGHILNGYSVAIGNNKEEALANFRKMAEDELPGRADCEIREVREIAIAPAAYAIFNGEY